MYRYTNILKTIRTITPQGHIAGGAVRDTILEKPLHDVDVFVDDVHVEEVAKLLRSDFGYVKVGEWKQYLGFSDPAMERVAKFEKAEETTPLCIIGLKSKYASPEANIARFDFGICMAAFDGNEVLRAPEFDTDAENKVFTLHRADNFEQFAYSLSRHRKITAGRYQGWGLSIADDFMDLAKEYEFRRHWYTDNSYLYAKDERYNDMRPKERVTA